jgi:hypothetical protein
VIFFEREYLRLRELLIAEAERTSLPEEATARDDLHHLLLRLRQLSISLDSPPPIL